MIERILLFLSDLGVKGARHLPAAALGRAGRLLAPASTLLRLRGAGRSMGGYSTGGYSTLPMRRWDEVHFVALPARLCEGGH